LKRQYGASLKFSSLFCIPTTATKADTGLQVAGGPNLKATGTPQPEGDDKPEEAAADKGKALRKTKSAASLAAGFKRGGRKVRIGRVICHFELELTDRGETA
jgi:hypothetical protein